MLMVSGIHNLQAFASAHGHHYTFRELEASSHVTHRLQVKNLQGRSLLRYKAVPLLYDHPYV